MLEFYGILVPLGRGAERGWFFRGPQVVYLGYGTLMMSRENKNVLVLILVPCIVIRCQTVWKVRSLCHTVRNYEDL